jgi:hypothetical protein
MTADCLVCVHAGHVQAVLVRDNEYKVKLQQQLGIIDEQILMLTPQECKGLEFQVSGGPVLEQ